MRLWHEAAGEGSPVLLLHAGICDSRMWEPQWRTWPSLHRAVRCDLRGFGRTPLPPEPFAHARDVVELLEQLNLGTVALVGVSMGGRVALEAAVARPDLVSRLVLVGPGIPGHAWSDEMRRFDAEEAAALARGDVEAAVQANLDMWVDGRRRAGEVDPDVRRAVREMQHRAFELQLPVMQDAEEELLVPDLTARLGDVRAPTLLVTGAHDVTDIHAIAERLTATIPGARACSIPDAAHLPSLERPGEFTRAVLPFLSAASSSG